MRQHDKDLRGVAWSVVRSSQATDDVMQNAYEKAFRSLHRFDGRSALTTWLHSIVYRTALDHLRYQRRRRHDEIESVDAVIGRSDSTSSRAIDALEVREALDGLDATQRAALMLTAGLGYSYDEAAQITRESRDTLASRASRARSRISRWEAS